ncbi:hypothetical protein VMUT_2021 [Vulcanisaeta moutnovskia 768-28]|uniref:Uncharacterized protein n=1 Tax=Vulcanisaeta moutnovskia (strain 768-28) TaxID=985053 RepID=F0QWC4_VULM7|nr:hypothetical protein [Vulcanisaeta moutnovskia]ADY02219.1 hypothetical protein VMUT_2021 [Vulcanisaeta moutnovskia 768-28]
MPTRFKIMLPLAITSIILLYIAYPYLTYALGGLPPSGIITFNRTYIVFPPNNSILPILKLYDVSPGSTYELITVLPPRAGGLFCYSLPEGEVWFSCPGNYTILLMIMNDTISKWHLLYYNYEFAVYVNGTIILTGYLINGTFVITHYSNGVFGFIANVYYGNCLGMTPLGFNNESMVLIIPSVDSTFRVIKYVGFHNSIAQLLNGVVTESLLRP